MVFQDLPQNTISGTVLQIRKPTPTSPFVIEIDTGKGVATQKIDYEQIKRWLVGFTSIKDAIGKKISLTTQGYDAKGNQQVRYGTLS
jgi:hypothetical protein